MQTVQDPLALKIGSLVTQSLYLENMLTSSIQNQLQRIAEKIKWVPCLRCHEEWSKLNTNGTCPDCDDIDVRKVKQLDRLKSIIGEYASQAFTLDKFKTDTEEREIVKDIALKFNPTKDNLFLQGSCGTGKTHLATALFLEWDSALKSHTAFQRTSSLVRFLRGKTGNEEDGIIESLANKRLLVIDDLGLGKSSEFLLTVLYDLICARMDSNRNGLIITSNLTFDDIAKKFGDDRLTSRINKLCRVVRFSGPDFRMREPYS